MATEEKPKADWTNHLRRQILRGPKATQ